MLSLVSQFGHAKVTGHTGAGYITAKAAISKDTVDSTAIFTNTTKGEVRIVRAYWQPTEAFTGGASSTIGLDSDNASYNTAGDILGGAAGDAAANLGVGYKGGTVGAKMSGNQVVVLAPGESIRFRKITSAFGTGKGFAVFEIAAVDGPS